jgi:glycosyltransferase involved in cell wall biosynthesis
MPAYNAAKTLRKTHAEVLAQGIVDLIVVVDDKSHDETVAIALTLPKTRVHLHERNLGYGGNQKTCYQAALQEGADVIIMIHPDYQYTPLLIPAMAVLIGCGLYHCVLGSRILGGGALHGGMPWWKYVANRALTLAENLLLGGQAYRIPHRPPGLFAGANGNSPLPKELRRLYFRQPVPCPGLLAGVHHCRDHMPDEIFQGGLVDHFPAQPRLWVRMLGRRPPLPLGEMGLGAAGLNHHLRVW